MTGAEKLRQEGREEGRLQGRAETLLKQLSLKLKAALPAPVVDRVRCACPDELELWTERVLDAKCLDDVFE